MKAETKERKMKEKVAKQKSETKENIESLKPLMIKAARLEKEIKKLQLQLEPFADEIADIKETELKKIEIIRRKGSILLLTNWNTGLVLSNPNRSTHYEKTVNRYDNGKKGKLISKYDRKSIYFWKNYLLTEKTFKAETK